MANGNISSIHVFSPHGEDMLETFLKDSSCRIIMAREFLDHDGFDSDGPKSNIWYLFFIVHNFKTNKYNYYSFNTEDRFTGKNVYYSFNTMDNHTCSVITRDDIVLPKLETIKESTWKMFDFWRSIDNGTKKYIY
jgi:hypothetical protein